MTDTVTAIRYYQPIPEYVKDTPSGTEYVFAVRHGISLAWIKQEDVDNILDRTGGCCDKKTKVFSKAGPNIVRVWQEGGRP